MQFSTFLTVLAAASLACATTVSNRAILIRHGEKTSDDSVGLSSQGMQRAQCLRNVFGKSSSYSIGLIMAQQYDSDGSRIRPYQTVKPLADDLGLTVDVSCDRDDRQCVGDRVKAFSKTSSKGELWSRTSAKRLALTSSFSSSSYSRRPDLLGARRARGHW
jgi:hypothetical protein